MKHSQRVPLKVALHFRVINISLKIIKNHYIFNSSFCYLIKKGEKAMNFSEGNLVKKKVWRVQLRENVCWI